MPQAERLPDKPETRRLTRPGDAPVNILMKTCSKPQRRSGSVLAANEADSPENVRMIGAANDVLAIAPISEEVGHADHWFQVSPFGRFPHRVGMQVFDRQAANSIVARFRSARDRLARLWRGLPVFVGHPDMDPKTYPDHRKYGSIRELEVRADGLWARPRWSRAGREIVNDEHYDFQSPLWNMEPVPDEPGAFRPVELISVGLTNRPNIPGKPVGANTNTAAPDPMKNKLIARFGLKPLAGADEVTDAQIEQTLDAQRAAANERPALAQQLAAANEARAAERRARIAEKLALAANAGRITASEQAGWQARFEQDFEGADAALARLVPAMNTRATMLTAHLGGRNGGAIALSRAARIQAANEAVDAYMKAAGTSDYQAAFVHVQRTKPELFQEMQQPEKPAA